jgi:hypothetical protein
MITNLPPMISIILFVDGFPVQFLIERINDTVFFLPIGNRFKMKVPQNMTATLNGRRWTVSGTEDGDLIDQVIEDLTEEICFDRSENI